MNSITRSFVCGVTCHAGGLNCNGYCTDQKIKAPGTYEVAMLNFGAALDRLKLGMKVSRAGWNGKGMWIAMGAAHPGLEAGRFWNEHARKHANQNGGNCPVQAYILMKTAQGDIQMGWSPTQSDVLAEDWQIVL